MRRLWTGVLALALLALLLPTAETQVNRYPPPTPSPVTIDDFIRYQLWFEDFGNVYLIQDWLAGAALVGGLLTGPTNEAGRVGQVAFVSVAAANSGYRLTGATNSILIGGGETVEGEFKLGVLTNVTCRFGMQDSTDHTDAVDGAYLEIASTGAVTGKTANNSTRSTTGTSYTASTGVWYRMRVAVNANATSVTYSLAVSGANAAPVWSDSLTTNIPTGITRNTNIGFTCTDSVGGTQVMVQWDWVAFSFSKPLSRANTPQT